MLLLLLLLSSIIIHIIHTVKTEQTSGDEDLVMELKAAENTQRETTQEMLKFTDLMFLIFTRRIIFSVSLTWN